MIGKRCYNMLMNILKLQRDSLTAMVEQYAKYQKVMLIYDDCVSNSQIDDLYQEIKNICIFNKIDVKNENLNEVYNGYKMLIFFCQPESFLKIKINLDEFVNIMVVEHNRFLPYCLNQFNTKTSAKLFLIDDSVEVDKSAYSSIEFNVFYNFFNNLYYQQSEIKIDEKKFFVNGFFAEINQLPEQFEFVDIDVLKKSSLDYAFLPIIDYILLAGFQTFFYAVKHQTLTMTDLYKTIKTDQNLIDKFYLLSQNQTIIFLIDYNYTELQQMLDQAINRVKNFIFPVTDDCLAEILEKLKEYCKNCSGLLNYLFLYDMFKL